MFHNLMSLLGMVCEIAGIGELDIGETIAGT